MTGRKKVALITGASGGIGRVIALKLAAEGYNVGIHYHTNLTAAQAVVKQAQGLGALAAPFGADACNVDALRLMISNVVDTFGKIDLLVNNAGITVLRSFLDVDEEMMSRLIAANLKAPFFLAQAAAKKMIEGKTQGNIINITSVQQRVNFPEASVYGTVKAALAKLTEHMAVELAPHGIRVNAIAPGYIKTNDGDLTPREQYIRSRIPLQQLGTAYDVAELVAFVASDAGKYLHGANIAIDGGMPLPSAADNLYTPRVVTDKLG